MTKPLGCLSRNGIIAALVVVSVMAVVSVIWGGRLFSPGPLNAQAGDAPMGGVVSHAETGGRCTACHPAPWSRDNMAERCLVCHTQIGEQLGDPGSLHGALLAADDSLLCRTCHPEHRGADANLTIVDPKSFPHDATGYSLQGHEYFAAGRTFSCVDCHGLDLSRFDPAMCADCHSFLDAAYTEAHLDAFGPGCLDCHDGVDRYGSTFDHNGLAFPLLGAHATLTCADCHRNARSPADLQGAPQDCFSCHQSDDAHEGRFGQDCAQCHTPEDWARAEFDHTLAAFALTGKHVTVDCQACHVGGVYRGTPQDCYSCHQKDDAHEGRFGQDCAQCHTPEDWARAEFDHTLAAFALTGAHVSVPCTDCHVNGVFRGTPQVCSACHQEPVFHAGLLGADCAACHTTGAWSPASYNQPHTFPFTHGEGGANSCRTCHPETVGAYTCYTCHEHEPAEIEGKHREEGIADFQDCVRCHPTGEEDEGGEDD